jgi:Xaa-Pro aminopeptidase
MSHAPTAALKARHQQVWQECAAFGVDALIVTALPNILYLTNFTGSSAIVVLTPQRLHFLTDFRYVTAVAEMKGSACECPDMEVVTVQGSYDAQLAALLPSLAARRIGIEAAHLTVSRYDWLQRMVAREFVPTVGIVERARVVKDVYEIATLREAGRRLSSVARAVPSDVRPGRTEREIALGIDRRIHEAGFSRTAFDTIVAAGPNSALPHARPTERKLSEGDLVVLDFGGVYDSYCVDLTRTVVVGRASERVRSVYGAVLEAHDRAIASVRPGTSRFVIDAAARDTLGRYGLAEAFGHGTGHGLGIEVHEDPKITRRANSGGQGSQEKDKNVVDVTDEAVLSGMAFTIEPGAYLPGWGGVRIEDDVLVTENGVEALTDAPTDLIEI